MFSLIALRDTFGIGTALVLILILETDGVGLGFQVLSYSGLVLFDLGFAAT